MQGYTYFLIFHSKHTLWVLVRTASTRGGSNVIYVLSNNKKNNKNFQLNFFRFLNLKNFCLLHGQVFVIFIGLVYQVVSVTLVYFKIRVIVVTELKS